MSFRFFVLSLQHRLLAGKYGLYSYKGDCLFRPLFDSIENFEYEQCVVSVEGVEGTIDNSGWIDPSFMDEICNEGLRYDREGNASKAYSVYERILTIDPNHVMALNNQAIIDIDNKDYNKGMKKLKLAHKLAPDNELISDNLHKAKKNRNERRWNRINTGLEIAAAIITLGAATYSVASGQSVSSSGLSSSGNVNSDSSVGNTSGGMSDKSSSSKNSKQKVNHANWKMLDRAYGGYEDQLIKMKSSGNYDKQEVKNIQKKMTYIRKKIYEQSGHDRAVSSMETWSP